jgi:hypothetical protein
VLRAAAIEEYGRSFAATIRLMMGPGTPIELCPDDSGRYDLRSYPWEQVNRQDFWSSTKFLRRNSVPSSEYSCPFIYG